MQAQAFTQLGDGAAAAEAARLRARGRRVRFLVKLDPVGKVHHVEAVDADPWAAGWTKYYEHDQMWRWMPIIIGAAWPFVAWMAMKAKAATP